MSSTTYGIVIGILLAAGLLCGCKSVTVNINILTTRSAAISASPVTNSAVEINMVVSGGANSNSATIPIPLGEVE